ncbi:hypothetical protein GTU79_26755 [Sodalis ligni]|jgi:hypothetical protein|uniref:TonB-like protein n=1 Tax=Sodalis ligni TaxID=2697027 RepID=A0A4R1NEN5_9GAMM|nr:hypothetical protein [Sodalis ligni]QWA10729.1 hypothetical protein GTU79_26755 [Sodalis ligni]TCL05883.1 hypothetical protein EZJ58_4105 [Sodalis ligni]
MSRGKQAENGWKSRLMGLLALFIGSVAVAPASAGPQDWDSYGRYVGLTLQESLARDDNPAARRFHDFLDGNAQKNAEQLPDLVVRVWLDDSGKIVRLGIPELGNAQAAKDLFEVLTAQPLGRQPPQDMPMPLILRLQLTYKV